MDFKQKKFLLLSSRTFEVQFVTEAQKIGYRVITTGNLPSQPAHRYSDEYINHDYTDFDGMTEIVARHGIDALSMGCSDLPAILAAYIGEKLGLPGHDTYENALIIHRKDAFKKFALENGVPTPRTRWYSSVEDALSETDSLEWPRIVKPTDRGGGQGISVANGRGEYEKAVRRAFSMSRVGHIVSEPFVSGTLHSMSTFLVDRKVVAYGTANDYSFHNPYMTNTGLFPADHGPEQTETLIAEVNRIAEKLRLVDGLLHFQYIIDKDGKAWIIEMMRRAPGNRFLSALSNSTGLNWLEWIIRAEAGENCRLMPRCRAQDKYYGYHSIMAEGNGRVREIVIDPELRPYAFQYEPFAPEGHVVRDCVNEKLGSVQFRFPDAETKNRLIPKINQLAYAKTD